MSHATTGVERKRKLISGKGNMVGKGPVNWEGAAVILSHDSAVLQFGLIQLNVFMSFVAYTTRTQLCIISYLFDSPRFCPSMLDIRLSNEL